MFTNDYKPKKYIFVHMDTGLEIVVREYLEYIESVDMLGEKFKVLDCVELRTEAGQEVVAVGYENGKISKVEVYSGTKSVTLVSKEMP